MDADSTTLTTAYENRVEKTERDKLVLVEKLENLREPLHPFAQMFGHALQVLGNYGKAAV